MRTNGLTFLITIMLLSLSPKPQILIRHPTTRPEPAGGKIPLSYNNESELDRATAGSQQIGGNPPTRTRFAASTEATLFRFKSIPRSHPRCFWTSKPFTSIGNAEQSIWASLRKGSVGQNTNVIRGIEQSGYVVQLTC